MIDLLEPMAKEPGVELALLCAHDGVAIAACGRASGQAVDTDVGGMTKDDGLAAMSAAWVHELSEAVAPLSWLPAHRISLRGARGILVLQRMESAILVVLLSHGLSPDDVRLSMDATVARIERTLRPSSQSPGEPPGDFEQTNEHPGPLPSDPVESATDLADGWGETADFADDTPPPRNS